MAREEIIDDAPKIIRNDRLTIKLDGVHESVDGDPTPIASCFDVLLESKEQVWVRRINLGTEWIPLDCGWISSASLVFIQNKSDSKDHSLRSIFVGFGDRTGRIIIQPGRFLSFTPIALDDVVLSAMQPDTKVSIIVVPE